MKNPLILIILDGWGERRSKKGNAIALANTSNFDNFKKKYPYTQLKAFGKDVGLLEDMMGNSEVGHLNIGAGRIVIQSVRRINKMIKDGSFSRNNNLLKAFMNVKKNKSVLHLMGLLSDRGVHAYNFHLYVLLRLAKKHKLNKVMIHVFTDGRDTPIKSAEKYIKELNEKIKKYGVGKIATVIGRYYSMDRDNRWKRTERAYLALIGKKGARAKTALDAVKIAYNRKQTDEFIKPIMINDFKGIKENDSVVFYNYRADRSRQITKAFIEKGFNEFKTNKMKLVFVGMTEYYKKMPAHFVLKQLDVKNTLGEVISNKGFYQLRMAETEKYAHVTYFLNGMKEKPFSKEDRIIIPSPKVATYDLKPEMSALKLTRRVLRAIKLNKYKIIVLNFANSDMVGHTGNIKAATKAVEVLDKCLARIVKAVQKKQGIVIITADHGNAEEMINTRLGEPLSEHSTNPVPFIIISDKKYILKQGGLDDIAPTILELFDIKKPKQMTGRSLIRSRK